MGNSNDTDTVFSIDVTTGKVVWTHSYPCNEKVGIKDYDGPFATPTVANGVVYTLSRKGDVFASMRSDGKVIWARNIVKEDDVRPPGFGGLAGSPLILGDKIDPEWQLRRHGARREDRQDAVEIRRGAPAAMRHRCRCRSDGRPTWRSTRPEP